MNRITIFTLMILFVAVSGCGPKIPSDMPPLYPVKVTVMMDGEPLEKASIAFTLMEATGGYPIGGTTDSKGVAAPKTNGKYDGVPEGKYKISVNKMVAIEGPTSQKTPPTDPQELAKYERRVYDERRFVEIVEKQFASSSSTPFEIEVSKGGSNEATVEVTKIPGSPK